MLETKNIIKHFIHNLNFKIMKKLFVTVVMMSLSITTFAQVENESTKADTVETTQVTKQSGESELPVAVKDAISKNYPEAQIVEISEKDQDGVATFEVKLESKDKSLITVRFNDKGEVVK